MLINLKVRIKLNFLLKKGQAERSGKRRKIKVEAGRKIKKPVAA